MLYSQKIRKSLVAIQEMGIKIDIICPDHGIIWRKNPGRIIDAYLKWSNHETENKAVVIYDTMWKSTQAMAEAIAGGIASEGVAVKPIHIRKSHRSEILTEVLDARAVVVGAPTLNNQIFPTVVDVLTYMKGLKPKNKIGGAFGSYGWSGESVKLIKQELEAMNFAVVDPGVKIQYVPGAEALNECYAYGQTIGKAVLGR